MNSVFFGGNDTIYTSDLENNGILTSGTNFICLGTNKEWVFNVVTAITPINLSAGYNPHFPMPLPVYIREPHATMIIASQSTNKESVLLITPYRPWNEDMGPEDGPVRNAKAISEGKGFCFLKLHGTSVLPPQFNGSDGSKKGFLTFTEVFWERDKWLEAQNDWSVRTNPSPTMYFPWELLNNKDEFVTQDKFAGLEGLASGNLYFQSTGRTLHELCKAIWQRAQREIAEAEKISFVGLSMHEFLKPGLRNLFAERVRKHNAQKTITHNFDYTLEIVLACPDAWLPGEIFRTQARPNSTVAKLAAMLCDVNPNMAGKIKGQIISHDSGKRAVGGIVCYDNFKSFIEAEL